MGAFELHMMFLIDCETLRAFAWRVENARVLRAYEYSY